MLPSDKSGEVFDLRLHQLTKDGNPKVVNFNGLFAKLKDGKVNEPKLVKLFMEKLVPNIAKPDDAAKELEEEKEPEILVAPPSVDASNLRKFMTSHGAIVTRSAEFDNILCVEFKGQKFDINERTRQVSIRGLLISRGFNEHSVMRNF